MAKFNTFREGFVAAGALPPENPYSWHSWNADKSRLVVTLWGDECEKVARGAYRYPLYNPRVDDGRVSGAAMRDALFDAIARGAEIVGFIINAEDPKARPRVVRETTDRQFRVVPQASDEDGIVWGHLELLKRP